MDDSRDSAEGLRQRVRVVDVGLDQLQGGVHQQLAMALTATRQHPDRVAAPGQLTDQVTTDESGATD